ncbi:MAG: HlyC/CorC family transporter [Alphaproteobacteria bacterium]|nr:HlyC/CorC family transporter [Alphaproteobacteria bacterium]
MHPFPWLDVGIILLLIALNGVFAMSELAIVSSRKPRLQAMEKTCRYGAGTALRLQSDPGRFLSTVQIGITLVGILAGAYSGASLGGPTAERLVAVGVPADPAEEIGFAVVIGLTTYASLIIGELVPKQFALRKPEPIACAMAPAMGLVARVGAPLVWLLDQTSALIFRALGLNREAENAVTAEELHLVVAEAQTAGVIEESERAMISSVMRLADRPVRAVMTPRGELDWLDIDADADELRARLIATPHTRLPVAEGSVDAIVGVIQARDALAALLEGKPLDLRALMRRAPVVPDVMDATDALAVLQGAEVPMALVNDEYGHIEGVVTPADLLAAIAGVFASDVDEGTDPPAVQREDGSWLLSGALPADQLADRLGLDLPEDRDYHTAAGFALDAMKRIPKTGEAFTAMGWRFEVVDMDGNKIDKLLAAPAPRKAMAEG